ncbi:MAG: class I lanthipeptide [Hyphomicrobiales bacterium]
MKKLNLKKETIALLNNQEMDNVNGGEAMFRTQFLCFASRGKYCIRTSDNSCRIPFCIIDDEWGY